MILSRIREQVHGSVRFLFQPSEEKIPGGAPVMIKEGALDSMHETPASQAIFGQHVQPALPVGTIGIRSGPFMASADELFITIEGQGGHAAMPHLLSADPVLVASHLVIALQSVISRNCPPHVPSVLSFGRMIADGVTNVIPDRVHLEGTFRAMDETWRFEAHERIRRVVQHTVQAFGATCSLEVRIGYPFLRNDDALARHVREAAVEYVGEEKTIDVDLWMAAEDFAYYTHHMPGVFYMLGVRNEATGIVHGLHTPRFTLDEEALRLGPGFMAYLAWKRGVLA
jgi:hippurate hydrolase